MIRKPCQMGLKCPFKHYSDEDEELCTYPYLVPDEDQTYGFPEECDCGMLDYDTELYDIISVMEESDELKELYKKEKARLDEEHRKETTRLFNELFGKELI